ncbi:hypothetical protein Tco_0373947 [Tanacetum coccineum]
MEKPILNKAREQNLTKPREECNEEFEFSKELLTELQNNTFSERCEEDVIGHISKVLKILDLVKIAGVDPFQLRMKAFPLSLLKDAKKWWINEGDGNISTWEELVKKFFKKFYPLTCASNYDKMCDDDEEGCDPFEFIPWRNSKNRKEEGLLSDEVLSNKEWEEHEYGNPPNDSFPKPYLNINNEKDKNHHNENNRDADKSSGMDLSGAPQSKNISNQQPNEGKCRVDKFEVIKYTIGEGRDPLKFIPWRNLKFKDHKKADETTKCALLYTWIEIGKEEGLLNDEVSSDKEWEEHEYGNPPNDSFPKPYLNINHHNKNNRDADKSSGMDLSGAPQSENISNEQPNEGICRIDKFEVIKYTIGGTIRCILGFGIRRIDPCIVDLAETMIWYILKRTCVELIRAF